MSTVIATRPSPPPTRSRRGPNALARLWRDLVGSWRWALARAHEPAIDAATLRDLGMSRSELASFEAEARGDVEATRLRVLRHRTGVW
ncbi:MAG: hypothetical protein KIT17_22490 [Rubrivivax sp.]|nr:hypothetical protein [Rubrivivax sp.]